MLERQGREGRALQAHLASNRKGQASLTVAGEGGEGLALPRASSLKLLAGSWVPEMSLGLGCTGELWAAVAWPAPCGRPRGYSSVGGADRVPPFPAEGSGPTSSRR